MSRTLPTMKCLIAVSVACLRRSAQGISSRHYTPAHTIQGTKSSIFRADVPQPLYNSTVRFASSWRYASNASSTGPVASTMTTHGCSAVPSIHQSNICASSQVASIRKHSEDANHPPIHASPRARFDPRFGGKFLRGNFGGDVFSGGSWSVMPIRRASTGARSRVPESSKIASSIGSMPKDAQMLSTKRVVRRKKTKGTTSRDQEYFDVTAYTTADEYNLEALREAGQWRDGFTMLPLPEDALDVLHLLVKSGSAKTPTEQPRDVFLFREGSVVFWDVPEAEQQALLRLLTPHQLGAYESAALREEGVENLECTYTDGRTALVSGEILLHRGGGGDMAAESDKNGGGRQLELFAFSNAIALSVKLSVWEASLSNYVDSVEWVLQDLKEGKKIRMSEAEVLRKAGELFTLSHLVNLSSDLLDTPDFYWDRNQLEVLYVKTCNYLNIARRVKVMNEKLRQCVELTELLRDHLKDKHHTRLELMIIFLILIEVIFSTFHLVEMYWTKSRADALPSVKAD